MGILIILFWFFIALLIYTYLAYPLILIIWNKLRTTRFVEYSELDYLPKVDLVIAAYNEEKVIKSKIENSLRLDYPSELINIWIASDGSSDKTNDIVKSFAQKESQVHLLEFPRTGKSGIINKAMAIIKGDIIVFSDANTEYEPMAIKRLIYHFSNNKVGCVCGRLIYRNPNTVISGEGESFYWRFETTLKMLESKIGYIAGANGAIYAIRQSLFNPLPSNTINDDFTISMNIVLKGYKSLYEENAIAYEDVAPDMDSEFRRHVRDGAGHYIAITHLLGLLNPLLGIKSFVYWSHRILRWFAPFMLIFIFLINTFLLNSTVFQLVFYSQIIFYSLALLGLICVKLNLKLRFFMYIPFYFCNLNTALLIGFIKAVTGQQKTIWQSTGR
jgi:poly-beta-1,6-N-acetyl-D-glucosamine synthase